MIKFQEVQPDTLDLMTGKLFSPSGMEIVPKMKQSTQAVAEPDFGIPLEDFHSQLDEVSDLPIKQIKGLVDKHPQIKDKKTAWQKALQFLGGLQENIEKIPGVKEFGEGLRMTPEELASKTIISPAVAAGAFAMSSPGGQIPKAGVKVAKTIVQKGEQIFKGFKDLSTTILKQLEGKSSVSRQFIEDLANQGGVRQVEKDLIRRVVDDMSTGDIDRQVAIDFVDAVRTGKVGNAKITPAQRIEFESEARLLAPSFKINPELPPSKLADKFGEYLASNLQKTDIPVKEFADKVKTELLPLKQINPGNTKAGIADPRYEGITLPEELRGPVANYQERIYGSPIKTSAGDTHFSGAQIDNYFAHTRIEDLPATGSTRPFKTKGGLDIHEPIKGNEWQKGDTRRVIEIQSDLFQKGRLENEVEQAKRYNPDAANSPAQHLANRQSEIAKLEPYRNTWHERVIREEVKQAAKDGKTKLQFPTGETAMKIEGLGENNIWSTADREMGLRPEMLKVGREITQGQNDKWIITDVLGDGKFNAVPKGVMEMFERGKRGEVLFGERQLDQAIETFDISGKVDANNPIYKFYDKDVSKFLTNKFGAKKTTDPQGVSWFELDVPKDAKNKAIQAYGGAKLDTILKIGGATAFAGAVKAYSDYVIAKGAAGIDNLKEEIQTLDAEGLDKMYREVLPKLPEEIQKELRHMITNRFKTMK